MRMLRTNQSKITRVHTTLLASMCRAMPFSARALKKKHHIFFDVDIVVKNHKNVRMEMWFIVVCTQTFFSYCLSMLSEFAKVFERNVWRVQVAHLHNAARALSSSSWCFQLSTNLDKDFFRYLWYCGKKQIECSLAWHWWNSTDLAFIDVCLTNLNKEIKHDVDVTSNGKNETFAVRFQLSVQ